MQQTFLDGHCKKKQKKTLYELNNLSSMNVLRFRKCNGTNIYDSNVFSHFYRLVPGISVNSGGRAHTSVGMTPLLASLQGEGKTTNAKAKTIGKM